MNCHMPHTTYGLLKASRSHRIASPDAATTLATGRPNACNLCHLDRSLAWTADRLEAWYGTPRPRIDDPDLRSIALGAVYGLRGDAAQRALVAWHMGWAPARETAGSEWMVPILAQLLLDPYDAVRYIAHRSLRMDPAFAGVEFDYLGTDAERAAVRNEVLTRWNERSRESAEDGRRVILDTRGASDAAQLTRLLGMRDDRRIYRAE
jgi:hypothetical protein